MKIQAGLEAGTTICTCMLRMLPSAEEIQLGWPAMARLGGFPSRCSLPKSRIRHGMFLLGLPVMSMEMLLNITSH